ncbi:MAG: DUF190 domain-containing protein [Chloroflexi bacterium]|nr:DUF190 domain-containing protein [Chloroflexota bacterium]
MHIVGTGKRVRIYIHEATRWRGKGLMHAILERLRSEGCAGATVLRGVAGFGAHNRMATTAIEVLALNLPIIIEWVDNSERIERVLPSICAMVEQGLVTVEDVEIAKYAHRPIRPVPAALSVETMMSRSVITARPTTPVRELVELLMNRDYRALPIVTDDGKIAGIVTNSDLVERGALGVRLELLGVLSQQDLHSQFVALSASDLVAEDVMTREVVTVPVSATVREAVSLMIDRRLKRLPVVDDTGRLLGIVSRADILRSLGEGYEQPTSDEVSPSGHLVTVGEVMTREVPTVGAEAPLGAVLDAVVSTRLNRAVVVDADHRPIGVISDAELIRRTQPEHHQSLAQRLMRRLLSGSGEPSVHPATGSLTAADVMIAPIQTVTSDTPTAAAAALMLKERRKILPVVDASGRLVGALDRAVLLRAISTGSDDSSPSANQGS